MGGVHCDLAVTPAVREGVYRLISCGDIGHTLSSASVIPAGGRCPPMRLRRSRRRPAPLMCPGLLTVGRRRVCGADPVPSVRPDQLRRLSGPRSFRRGLAPETHDRSEDIGMAVASLMQHTAAVSRRMASPGGEVSHDPDVCTIARAAMDACQSVFRSSTNAGSRDAECGRRRLAVCDRRCSRRGG
jgi:hypothetical protein